MPNWINIEFPMPIYFGVPSGRGPFPGIVVLHKGNASHEIIDPSLRNESGVVEVTRDYCASLVAEGYAVAAPDLFHRLDESTLADGSSRGANMMDGDMEEDVNATVRYLLNHPSIDGERLGIMGFSLGGRAVWFMAGNPHFKAAVIHAAGAIQLPKSNRSYHGSVYKPEGGAFRTPFERSSEIKCPIMFHYQEKMSQGTITPWSKFMDKYDAELTRLGKPHQFFMYPGTRYHFAESDSEDYDPAAAKLAWDRTVDFLKKQVKGEG